MWPSPANTALQRLRQEDCRCTASQGPSVREILSPEQIGWDIAQLVECLRGPGFASQYIINQAWWSMLAILEVGKTGYDHLLLCNEPTWATRDPVSK